MPDMNCKECDGDGIVTVTYVNHETKTLRKNLVGCPTCNCDHDLHLADGKGYYLLSSADMARVTSEGYAYTN